jgi:SlyX protein
MKDDSDPRDERIVELEVRFTLQQDLLQQLSDALWEQQRVLDRLSAKVKQLEQRASSADEPEAPRSPEDDVPPHY